jgi:molecular chaperone DnaJ
VEAMLGTDLEINTLDGSTKTLSIDPGTQSGDRRVLRGEGVPDVRGRGRGDLYLQIRVITPTRLSSEQETIIREFGKSLTDDHKPQTEESMFDRIKSAFGG